MSGRQRGSDGSDGQSELDMPEAQPFTTKEWVAWREDVDRALGTHEGLLEEIIEILEDAEAGGRYHWDNLKDHHKAALMRRLVAFVDWLDRTYLQQVTTFELKPCWWQHPDILWQLTALMVAHAAVYNAAAKPSMDLVTFNTHALWPTLERIRENGTLRRCEKGKHDPSTIAALVIDEDLDKQIRAWEGESRETYSLDVDGGIGGDPDRDLGDGSRSVVDVEQPNHGGVGVDTAHADGDPVGDPDSQP